MSLEVLVRGKISIFIWLPCSNSNLHIITIVPFPRCL
jgi:hypothetical protein